MVTIKLFGSLRLKTGFKGMQAYVSTAKECCDILARATGLDAKVFKNCVIMINGKQAKLSSSLNEGDEVVFLAPSGGG